jgi:transposase-like protein
VIEAAVIRAVLPGHTVKRLARLMGVSPETAKHWLQYGPAFRRRRELARVLEQELDRQDAEERALARQWCSDQAT